MSENENESVQQPQVTDSLRGAQKSDQVLKTKIAYAPPTYIRVVRVVVSSIVGSIAILLFSWLYTTAYERANFIDVEQYIAEKYEGMKEQSPMPALEERTEIIFPGSSKLSEAGLDDLENFTQIVTVQFVESEIAEMRRVDSVLYFKIGRAEYSVELSSEDSYPYLDDLIKSGDFDFSRYFSETTETNNKENETNG